MDCFRGQGLTTSSTLLPGGQWLQTEAGSYEYWRVLSNQGNKAQETSCVVENDVVNIWDVHLTVIQERYPPSKWEVESSQLSETVRRSKPLAYLANIALMKRYSFMVEITPPRITAGPCIFWWALRYIKESSHRVFFEKRRCGFFLPSHLSKPAQNFGGGGVGVGNRMENGGGGGVVGVVGVGVLDTYSYPQKYMITHSCLYIQWWFTIIIERCVWLNN